MAARRVNAFGATERAVYNPRWTWTSWHDAQRQGGRGHLGNDPARGRLLTSIPGGGANKRYSRSRSGAIDSRRWARRHGAPAFKRTRRATSLLSQLRSSTRTAPAPQDAARARCESNQHTTHAPACTRRPKNVAPNKTLAFCSVTEDRGEPPLGRRLHSDCQPG
jgi:hypothetical protein